MLTYEFENEPHAEVEPATSQSHAAGLYAYWTRRPEGDLMLTRILGVYSSVLTTLLAAFAIAGSAAARAPHFD